MLKLFAAHFETQLLQPVPQRRAVDPVQPPLVPAFLSNNGQYVAIPQQAHNPKRSAQPALAADTQQLAAIPASAPGPGGLTGQDWFAANMMTALDKYERAAKAGQVKTDLAAP